MTVLVGRYRRHRPPRCWAQPWCCSAVAYGAVLFHSQARILLQPLMIAIPSAAVGVLVAQRQRRNPMGWLLLGITAAVLLSTGAGASRCSSTGSGEICRSARWG